MSTFILFIIGIFLSGFTFGLITEIITTERNKKIPQSFCDTNYVYSKFTDQVEVSIDEVVKKNFKLLDI